jgi:1-deoxy-D-xylulose-5-phosphate synthase
LTVEENVAWGGFGERVREALGRNGEGALPMTALALPDAFVEHGAQPLIRRDVGLDAEGIKSAALSLLGKVSTVRRR